MHIAEGVEMLEVSATIAGRQSTICPTLLKDNDSGILVDAGFPGQSTLIRIEIEKAGLDIEKLQKIVLTHQDLDHIGSAQAIRDLISHSVEVLAHAEEKLCIEGIRQLVKMTPEVLARMLASLPPDTPEATHIAMRKNFENPPKVAVDTVLKDRDTFSWYGGVEVIPTPGHTPGHISLYHKTTKTLVAGDSLVIVEGELQFSREPTCWNYEMAKQSIKNLLEYDIHSIICYHGGLYNRNANERIKDLVASLH